MNLEQIKAFVVRNETVSDTNQGVKMSNGFFRHNIVSYDKDLHQIS